MAIWLILILALGAGRVVLWPLFRATAAVVSGGGDRWVYRDRSAEIDCDRAEGFIDASEAKAASVALARRLLAAVDQPLLD